MAEDETQVSSSEDDGIEFSSSKLGTKEYWDEAFTRDLQIYKETGDVGEVWFGNASVKRVVAWLNESKLASHGHSILDVGCGNGMTLVSLARNGYSDITGVDYSSNAVALARAYASDKGLNIAFEVGNVVDMESCGEDSILRRCYDICIDKGTYDAISLNPDSSVQHRSKYQDSINRLVKTHGLFIITSCNWTEPELVQQFCQGFEWLENIPTPTFQFGGATGRKETVCVFRRINERTNQAL